MLVLLFGAFHLPSYFERNRMKAAVGETQQLRKALEYFWNDCGRLPTQEEGLQALLVNPANLENWLGPYVAIVARPDSEQFDDPWGVPYEFKEIDNQVCVQSAGPDRKLNTLDDIRTNRKSF